LNLELLNAIEAAAALPQRGQLAGAHSFPPRFAFTSYRGSLLPFHGEDVDLHARIPRSADLVWNERKFVRVPQFDLKVNFRL
jgi:hypothetical protein